LIEAGGQVICTVKYADVSLLLAKEETMLQGMTDRITEIEGKVKVMFALEQAMKTQMGSRGRPIALFFL
jgi:hypothetical protein